MTTPIDALEYVRRWESGDLRRVGQHTRDAVEKTIWPWLKERGYADDDDDGELAVFLNTQLGKRPAFLRPGLRLKRRWDAAAANSKSIADEVRAEVNAILAAAGEP